MIGFKYHVFVCTCPSCAKKGAERVLQRLRQKVEAEGLMDEVNISRAGCLLKGQCREHGPFVVLYPQNVWYNKVAETDVDKIIARHLKKGEIIRELLFFVQP